MTAPQGGEGEPEKRADGEDSPRRGLKPFLSCCSMTPSTPCQKRNSRLLRQRDHSRGDAARRHWRNALVCDNLGLVRLVANRESRRTGRCFEELCSAGYEGLIRAVEAFDSGRNCALSSFAVPYIRGAMLLDQRDRQQPIHTPRRLRELLQRARKLQEQRRQHGLSPLEGAELATALQCSLQQLEEAAAVQRALTVSSLDRPLSNGAAEGAGTAGGAGGDGGGSWHERLAAPSTDSTDEQLAWARQALARLDADDRELLEGRWIDGLSWSALAAQLGWSSQRCRQRALALMLELRRAAAAGLGAPRSPQQGLLAQLGASACQASSASRAARAV